MSTKSHTHLSAATEEVEQLRRQLQIAKDQRNAWQKVAGQAGVCMTCAMGAPDPYGCTDCLNTGWEQGAPHGYMPIPTEPQSTQAADRIEALEKALRKISKLYGNYGYAKDIARAALAPKQDK
jgi:hypothetical protein